MINPTFKERVSIGYRRKNIPRPAERNDQSPHIMTVDNMRELNYTLLTGKTTNNVLSISLGDDYFRKTSLAHSEPPDKISSAKATVD